MILSASSSENLMNFVSRSKSPMSMLDFSVVTRLILLLMISASLSSFQLLGGVISTLRSS